jgi:hypothetical protein
MPNGNALPDPDSAYKHLFNQVHQRVFFNKCAANGRAPQSEKQAATMLDLAARLRFKEQEEIFKSAQDAADPYAAATAELAGLYGEEYAHKEAQAADELNAIRGIAWEYAQNPDIYNCVLSVKAAEAAYYQQQAQQQ